MFISKTHPCLAAYWRRLNVSVVHRVIRTQMNLLALFISFFVNYFLFGFVCSFLVTSWFPHITITSVFSVVSRRVFSFATESSSTLTLTNVLASRQRSSSPGCMNSARTSNMSGGMPANQDEYGEEKGGNTCQPAQIRACRLWLGRGIHPRVRHSTSEYWDEYLDVGEPTHAGAEPWHALSSRASHTQAGSLKKILY